jgi:hypothetical protein
MQAVRIMVVAMTVGFGPAAWAEEGRLQPEFTFRRVGVPEPGSTRRMTVQIDPDAPSAIRAPDRKDDLDPPAFDDATESVIAASLDGQRPGGAAGLAAGAGPGPGASPVYDWFWEAISPSLQESGPGRLEPALALLSAPPGGVEVPVPRLQALQDIARAHGTDILRHTVGTQVSPALVLAVISVESAGRADAVSTAGAAGLMQLMPATAERFGVSDRELTDENIRGGVAYLDWLMGHFGGDPIMVLAAYNAGEGAVRDNGGVPPYAETRGYVPKVLAAFSMARMLCLTPPELVSDGCVFNVNAM